MLQLRTGVLEALIRIHAVRNEYVGAAIYKCPSIRCIFIDHCTQGLQPKCVAGIVYLRAVREGGDNIHLRTEIDVITSFALGRLDGPTAIRADWAVHKYIHVERN